MVRLPLFSQICYVLSVWVILVGSDAPTWARIGFPWAVWCVLSAMDVYHQK